MYGQIDPKSISEIDISFFKRSFLTQVCLGPFDLILNFDRPVISVTTQVGFRCLLDGVLQTHPVEQGHLLRPFLNKDVASAKWGKKGTLVISFEGGDEIHLLDESDRFESFTVSHAKTTIIV